MIFILLLLHSVEYCTCLIVYFLDNSGLHISDCSRTSHTFASRKGHNETQWYSNKYFSRDTHGIEQVIHMPIYFICFKLSKWAKIFLKITWFFFDLINKFTVYLRIIFETWIFFYFHWSLYETFNVVIKNPACLR